MLLYGLCLDHSTDASTITSSRVNTPWRSLVQTTLLDVYFSAIAYNFASPAVSLQPYIHESDRGAYVADLTSRECVPLDLFEA